MSSEDFKANYSTQEGRSDIQSACLLRPMISSLWHTTHGWEWSIDREQQVG